MIFEIFFIKTDRIIWQYPLIRNVRFERKSRRSTNEFGEI